MGRTSIALEREEATKTVAASLCLARMMPPEEAAPRVGPWIVATMAERLDLPPVGVVADLGALLFGKTRRPGMPVPTDDAALSTAVRRYEDALLGRLAVEGRLASAGFAVARLPREMHAQAVGILVAGVLSRIDYDAGMEAQPGIVRQLTHRKHDEALQRGYGLLRDDAHVRRRLTEAYASLARSAQKARDLIGDADLFALENLTVLSSLTQRLAIADVVRAQEAIAEALPRRLPRRRRKEGDIASKLEDESAYPAGGFSSVSTSGSLENLVSSELIYMDPPQSSAQRGRGGGASASPGVDLFDMRYVEGELLYYTRDEAIFVRRRRLVVLVLSADLARARVKDRELPWQRIVLVLGVVLVLTKKLAELLGEEALEIQVIFLHEDTEARTPLSEEQALAELMLREWRDKGMVEVRSASWSDVVGLTATNAKRALVEVVRFRSGSPTPSRDVLQDESGAPMRSKERPLDARVVAADFVLPTDSLEDWSRATSELLSMLL
jgi:hypothetical protein